MAALVAVSLAASGLFAQDFTLEEQQFNHWLYGRGERSDDADSEFTMAIEAINHTCHLADDQIAKLRLAARGDYARFERDVDELRSEIVGKTYDQNKIGEVYQQIQPLTKRYREGLLGHSSLFAKVIRSTLTPEQLMEFEAAEGERRRARHLAGVKMFVATLERRCPLNDEQRTALVNLLTAETRPALVMSEMDAYVVSAQAARIPKEKFQAILDDAQIRVLDQALRQGRGLEQHLRQLGVLADE